MPARPTSAAAVVEGAAADTSVEVEVAGVVTRVVVAAAATVDQFFQNDRLVVDALQPVDFHHF